MPNTPVSHIQKIAPGPPAKIAVATPTIEPVPMVAASAVASAPKGEISPSPSVFFSDILMACGIFRWMNRVRNVRKMCDPKRRTIIAGPQTKASICSRISITHSLTALIDKQEFSIAAKSTHALNIIRKGVTAHEQTMRSFAQSQHI